MTANWISVVICRLDVRWMLDGTRHFCIYHVCRNVWEFIGV